MKKRLLPILALLFLCTLKAGAAGIVWNKSMCSPGANGYEHVFYSASDAIYFEPLGIHVTIRRLLCEDPGINGCNWPPGTGPALTIPESNIMNDVTNQVAMGINSGHIRTDGTMGTLNSENWQEQWDGSEGYIWNVDEASCITVIMLPDISE